MCIQFYKKYCLFLVLLVLPKLLLAQNLNEKLKQLKIPKSELTLLIDKSDYTLRVCHKESVLKSYPIVLGFNPVDDKRREGDGCTPEGSFGVRSMYAHRSWTYFIWIDYPNSDSWKKHKKAKADGSIPPNATIGGEIGIHGVPEGADYLIDDKVNWTLGCISLKTNDIKEIYSVIGKTTRIKIVP